MEIQILNQFSFPIQIFLDGLQVKIGHECTGGTEEFLGQTASASECAKKCKGKVGCQYFIYGTDNTKCFHEEKCSTDKKNADYIIYKMTTGKKVIDCEIYCQRFPTNSCIYIDQISQNFLIEACPSTCATCSKGNGCIKWCSKYGFCGGDDDYKNEGTDCRACSVSGIFLFVLNIHFSFLIK